MHLDHEFTVPVPAGHAWPVLLDVERIGPCLPGATITKVEGRDFEGKVKVRVGPITVTYAGQAGFTDIDEEKRRAVIVAKGKEARGSGTANATITAQLHDEGEATRVTVRTDLTITGRPAQFGRGVLAEVGAKLLGRFADCLAGQLAADDTAEAPEAAPPAAGTAPAEPTEPVTGPPADEPAAAQVPPTPAGAVSAPPGTARTVEEPAAAPATEPAGEPAAAGAGAAPQQPAAGEATPPKPAAARAHLQESDTIDLLETAGGPILKRLAPVLAALVLLALLLAVLRRRDR